MKKGLVGRLDFPPVRKLNYFIWWIKTKLGLRKNCGIPIIVTDKISNDKTTVIFFKNEKNKG